MWLLRRVTERSVMELDWITSDGGVQGGCFGQMREMKLVGILMVNEGLVDVL